MKDVKEKKEVVKEGAPKKEVVKEEAPKKKDSSIAISNEELVRSIKDGLVKIEGVEFVVKEVMGVDLVLKRKDYK